MAELCITDMPDCILLKIFREVPLDTAICNLAKISQRFQNLTNDFTLWKRKAVQFRGHIPTTVLQKLRIFAADVLKCVDLSDNVKIEDVTLVHLLEHFKNITHLNLSRCSRLSSSSVRHLVNFPAKLHSLNLHGCFWLCPDVILSVVSLHSSTIRCLDITGCTKLTRDVARVNKMAEACSSLHSLSLGWLTSLPNGTNPLQMSPIIDTDIRKFARRCQHLTHIQLYRCHIGDDSVTSLASSCQKLTSLDLSYTYISNNGMALIGEFLPELKHLVLVGCWKISDQGLVKLAGHRLRLTSLNLKRCFELSAFSVAYLVSRTPDLRELNLARCFLINDLVLDCIARSCAKLGVLDISGTSVTQSKLTQLRETRKFPMAIYDARRLQK